MPLPAPQYFFAQKDFAVQKSYDNGFAVSVLFPVNSVGIVTSRDAFVTDNDKDSLISRMQHFFTLDSHQIKANYGLKENKSWKIDAIRHKSKKFDEQHIQQMTYRPFENRYIYYENNFIERSRREVMQHFLKGENIGLNVCRQLVSENYTHVFLTKLIVDDSYVSNKSRERGYVFPLYRYPNNSGQYTLDGKQERVPNLDASIITKISECLKLSFTAEDNANEEVFAPIDILDYIYAVLHSPAYRETYKEFLKIDFPRIPYPKNADTFWQLVKLGGELRQLHLLESAKVEQYVSTYPQDGNNTITRKINKESYELNESQEVGRVWINDTQYFDNVPQVAWDFYIGGYQPAQKWLKDRHNRELSFEDILHYQKIIVALTETDRIMEEIDTVNFME